jgi:hypothetical protein
MALKLTPYSHASVAVPSPPQYQSIHQVQQPNQRFRPVLRANSLQSFFFGRIRAGRGIAPLRFTYSAMGWMTRILPVLNFVDYVHFLHPHYAL